MLEYARRDRSIDNWQFIAFGFSFSVCYGTSVGLGRHETEVRPEWQGALKKAGYAFSVLYVRIRMVCGNLSAHSCRTQL